MDGSPVLDDVAARIACDAIFVAHLVGAGSEPLYLGRHSLVHQGYWAAGDANHELSFHRPGGSVLTTTAPPASRPSLFRTSV